MNAVFVTIFVGAVLLAARPEPAFAEVTSDFGLLDAIPTSNICLLPLPGSDADVLGFMVGDMIEAPKGNGVLIDAVGGLFHQRLDGSIESLQPRTGQYTRTLAALPWSDEVIAVGASETVVHSDLSIEQIAREQWSQFIGVFPSIRSTFLETERVAGSNPFFGITISRLVATINAVDGKYRLVTSNTSMADIDFIVDAPWFGTPIVWKSFGPFVIDREGVLRAFDLDAPRANGTGTRKLGSAQQFFAVPRFRTLYLHMGSWFRITPDRRVLEIQGLPVDATVAASFDPGSGDALFATTKGVFAVSSDGLIRALSGDAVPRQSIRALADDPIGDFVLAGGADGLFRIRKDTLEVLAIPNGVADLIGSVRQITPVGFANFDLVVTSKGVYAFANGNLEAIPALAPSTRLDAPSPVSVLPHLKRALVSRRNDVGPMIYDLRRLGPDGTCGLSLMSSHS